jgi:putative PIN family toxin of toxin-antitoxin system
MKRTDLFIFDVNTLVSAFLVGSFKNNDAFRRALKIGLVITNHKIKKELTDVFLREKFDKYVSLEERIGILSFLETQLIELKEPDEKIYACRDEKDNKYVELAVHYKASCIITGDKDLLVLHPFRNIPILSASDFLQTF